MSRQVLHYAVAATASLQAFVTKVAIMYTLLALVDTSAAKQLEAQAFRYHNMGGWVCLLRCRHYNFQSSQVKCETV